MIVPSIDYASLFRDSPNAYLVLSRDYTIVDMNAAYLGLTGRTRAELVGFYVFDAFPPQPDAASRRQAEELKASFDRVVATGKPDYMPLLRHAIPISTIEGDGFVDSLWSTSHHPVLDESGAVAFVFQFAQNISELRGALEHAIADAEHETDGAPDTGRPTTHRILAEAGILRRAASIESANRALISDRMRLLRLFDQSLSFTVFMREPEHVVELANPAYLKMVGEDDLHDRRYSEGHRGGPPVPVKLLDAVFESGVPIVERGLPLRIPVDADRAHTIYVDVVIQQIVDADGTVAGVFMQGTDVTLAKATQDELSAYRSRLEEMVAERTRALEKSEQERRNAETALHRAQRLEAVGKLTGGVAHDFNNVLQIIRGNLQLMQRTAPVHGGFMQRIEAALDGVDRGAKLASQLLAFGRRQPLEPVVVDLGRVLRRMDDLLRRALGESIAVRTHVQDGLWNTLIDVPRLENVILNIAINARDAMDHRGTLTMDLANTTVDEADTEGNSGLVAGDFVTLAIADTGSGMTAEVQRRAFEPFFTTKPEGEGTGLGLSMVYGFMKQSGGNVTLASEEGRGTTMRLYMPRSDEPMDEAIPAPVAAPMRGAGETILVVEDDEAVRMTVVETLVELGYRVLRAADGRSALTIVESGVPIDLLFTDVIMPGPVPSTEMVRQARLLLPRLQVLFTSGYTRDAIVERDRLRTGVNLLSKPYAREDLARRLRQLLDGAGVDTEPNAPEPTPVRETAPNVNPPVEASAPAQPKRRVLLVEDSEEVRETTIEFINEVGFDVVAVESAEDALDALAASRFDIVFTDVSLPGMSGIDLLHRLRETDREQRVVIASGYGSDFGRNALGAGVAVLSKPYDLAALEHTLNAVLEPIAAKPDGRG